jgi:hypothetical protein
MSMKPRSFVEAVKACGRAEESRPWTLSSGASPGSRGDSHRRHGATRTYEASSVDIPATLQETYEEVVWKAWWWQMAALFGQLLWPVRAPPSVNL